MLGSPADDGMRVREDYGEEVRRGVWLETREKGSVRGPGKQMRCARKHAESSDWRDEIHAAALVLGGARNWISAAVSRSMTRIGPPHLGQG